MTSDAESYIHTYMRHEKKGSRAVCMYVCMAQGQGGGQTYTEEGGKQGYGAVRMRPSERREEEWKLGEWTDRQEAVQMQDDCVRRTAMGCVCHNGWISRGWTDRGEAGRRGWTRVEEGGGGIGFCLLLC